MNPKYIAININFDSLNEAFNFPRGFRDPSYFEAFDKIADITNHYNLKLSIFVIGKDLENPEVFARVRDWSSAGHEIANHTWSHPMNLGTLKMKRLRSEIVRAHEIITRCTGREPKGFISPAWSTSPKVASTLINLNYTYDTSIFPSIMLFPMLLKMAFNHLNNRSKLKVILNRRDWFYPFTKPITPYLADEKYKCMSEKKGRSILVLPLPTLSRFTFPCWHTIGFLLGWDYAVKLLKKNISNSNFFYYLLHPADFVDPMDLQVKYSHSLQRLNIGVQRKYDAIKKVFDVIASFTPVFLTIEEIAAKILESRTKAIINMPKSSHT